MQASAEAVRRDPYAALRHSDYRFFLAGRLAASMGSQMIDVRVDASMRDEPEEVHAPPALERSP